MTIQVILADDQPLVRAGLRRLIEWTPDIDVAGEAGTGAEAVRLAKDTGADVVVMDIRMPGMDGIEATQLITSAGTHARVLVLTTFHVDEHVVGALRAGASGFLLKDALAADLLSAVRIAASGEAVVAPAVTRRLIERFIAGSGPHPTCDTTLDVLTPRERETLTLVARGLSNAEIAARLFLSEGTVKTHVSRVLAKLGLRDRIQAVILAYEVSLIRPGESAD